VAKAALFLFDKPATNNRHKTWFWCLWSKMGAQTRCRKILRFWVNLFMARKN